MYGGYAGLTLAPSTARALPPVVAALVAVPEEKHQGVSQPVLTPSLEVEPTAPGSPPLCDRHRRHVQLR